MASVSAYSSPGAALHSGGFRPLEWSSVGLVFASWISAGLFGLYILAFYLKAIPEHLENWNQNLPGLYDKAHPVSLVAMSLHLLAGGIILLLGPIQLFDGLRERWPGVHRWIGRVYVFTAGVAGLGGLVFIVDKGTIGGVPMSAGFGLYGLLMTYSSFATYCFARLRQFDRHRAWAVRLFALAIGSWLYRMDYGFWLIAMNGAAHTHDFRGAFDVVMAFAFYLPNLAVAELYLRAKGLQAGVAVRFLTATAMNVGTAVVAVGTYYFARYYWGPAILSLF